MSVALHAFEDEASPAAALGDALGLEAALVHVHRFPDGEILPTVPPVAATTIVYRGLHRPNPRLVELLLAHEAWRRGGAARLVLVAPYLGYMRQDTVTGPGAAVSQRAVGTFLAGLFDRVVTVDPHLHRTPDLAAVLPGIEADALSAAPVLAAWLAAEAPGAVLVGPDAESRRWVEPLAALAGRPWLTLAKTRSGDRDVRVELDGDAALAGRPVVLVDDVCASGETLVAAAGLVRARGAGPVRALVTHALHDEAVAAGLRAAGIEQVASTDAVPHPSNAVPLAGLLARSLRRELGG